MKPYRYLTESRILGPLLDLARNGQGWVKYHEFDALIVPHHILAQEPFFRGLPPFVGGVLRMGPNTCYSWHVDGKRLGAINMLLEHEHSHCLFAAPNAQGTYFQTVELPYEPGHFYAFDTQVPHTVFNGPGYRYLFSIEFAEPLPYEELVTLAQSGQESG